jgi:hypothetical protein
MVVNSALSQPDMEDVVDAYVMNQAALAAEAFSDGYQSYMPLAQQAMQQGYPTDQLWEEEWAQINIDHCGTQDCTEQTIGGWIPWRRWNVLASPQQIAEQLSVCSYYTTVESCSCRRDVRMDDITNQISTVYCSSNCEQDPCSRNSNEYVDDYEEWFSLLEPLESSTPSYQYRWRTDPNRSSSSSTFTRHGSSPWRGLFSTNVGNTTRIYNTYNPNDMVLRSDEGFVSFLDSSGLAQIHAWYTLQARQKPDLGFLVAATPLLVHSDNRTRKFWARLKNTEKEQEYLWIGLNPPVSPIEQTRRWAELSYWFPVLSPAAGTVSVDSINQVESRNFSLENEAQNAKYFDTHSYMTKRPVSEVWCAYELFHNLLTVGHAETCSKYP